MLLALVASQFSPEVFADRPMHTDAGLRAEVEAARMLAGVDPRLAIPRLEEIRNAATASGDLKVRLAVDEAECFIQADTDVDVAHRVAEAGLAVAAAAGAADLQPETLRLRVCRASILQGGKSPEAGAAELEEVLAIATSRALEPVRALALLVRGVFRTRDGSALSEGQSDLLTACRLFDTLGMEIDRDSCLWFLAQHEVRSGDKAEATALMKRLLQGARQRGAVYNQVLYTMGLGQVHENTAQFEAARADYIESLGLAEQVGERSAITYLNFQMAQISMKLDRPADALAYLEKVKAAGTAGQDPEMLVRAQMVRGRALTRLHRSAEASATLAAVERSVNDLGKPAVRREWLDAQRSALAASNEWRTAYELLAERAVISEKIELQARSEQSARMRSQFNRDRDMAEVESLQRLNAQGQRLRQAQGAALAMFVLLLIGTAAFAWIKWRQSRRLQTLALTDELTGLPNRRAVMAWAGERFTQSRRLSKPMAVLIVDADRFKLVNDQHGHAVGDEVLRELARRLPDALRRGRDRLGRMGGEEFLGVLPDTSAEQAVAIAQRMRESICASPFDTSIGPLVVTVSIGLALRDPEAAHADESLAALSQRADEALYAAKAGGRNQVVTAPPSQPPPVVQAPERRLVPIVLRTRPADLRAG